MNVPVRWQYKGTLLDLFTDIIAFCVKKQTLNYYENTHAAELSGKLVCYYLHYSNFVFSLFVNCMRINSESLRTLMEDDLNESNREAKPYIRIIFSCSHTNSVFIKGLILASTKRGRMKGKINFWYYFNFFSLLKLAKQFYGTKYTNPCTIFCIRGVICHVLTFALRVIGLMYGI